MGHTRRDPRQDSCAKGHMRRGDGHQRSDPTSGKTAYVLMLGRAPPSLFVTDALVLSSVVSKVS